MPPVQSVPSDEVDDDVAFKVLNQDNLPISIIGESILKPFNTDSHKQKPNVIVYPTRRVVNTLEDSKQRQFTKSNGYINAQDRNDYNLRKNISSSHGNLNHTNSTNKLQIEDLQNQTIFTKFTRTLDAKLRKLQRDEKVQSPSKKPEISKKPFVTVVKKGQFLEPPPEIACLLGLRPEESVKREEKKLYAYASKPTVLNRIDARHGHRMRCEAAVKAAACVVEAIAGIQNSILQKDINSNLSRKLA